MYVISNFSSKCCFLGAFELFFAFMFFQMSKGSKSVSEHTSRVCRGSCWSSQNETVTGDSGDQTLVDVEVQFCHVGRQTPIDDHIIQNQSGFILGKTNKLLQKVPRRMILLGLFRQIVRSLTRLSSHYFSTMPLGQANWQQIVPFEFCISGATKQVRAFKLGNGGFELFISKGWSEK